MSYIQAGIHVNKKKCSPCRQQLGQRTEMASVVDAEEYLVAFLRKYYMLKKSITQLICRDQQNNNINKYKNIKF